MQMDFLYLFSILFNVSQVQSLPVTFQQVQQATKRDPVLSKLLRYVREGWPTQIPDEFKAYHNRQHQITIEHECLLWGIRVIIPTSLRQKLLEALHEGHPGVVRMKAIARSYMWWSGLDKDVENQAKSCLPCQEQKSNPPAAPLHTWQWPTTPWKRIHTDFAGPFLGKMFLIVVDAHSKWPEVIMMSTRPKRLKHFKQYLRDLAYRNSWCLIMDPSSHLKNSSNLYNRVESSTFEVHPITHQLTDWRNDLYKLLRIV